MSAEDDAAHWARMGAEHAAWTGLAVYCPTCLVGFVPAYTEDGWRIPVHPAHITPGAGYFGENCPGSLSGADVPRVRVHRVPAPMAECIEAHVLAAMPPDPNDVVTHDDAWLDCPMPACPSSNTCAHGCAHRTRKT